MVATTVEMPVAKLFDEVQSMLGIGTPDDNYYAWKMQQVSILRAVMKRQRLSAEDVLTCARYCVAHRLQPETYGWMLLHLGPAKAWSDAQNAGFISADLEAAIAYEHALADEESDMWLERLYRAQSSSREGVLDEWRGHRGQHRL